MQVADFSTGLRDMRLQSSVSLIGRQRVDDADAAQLDVAMSAASATVCDVRQAVHERQTWHAPLFRSAQAS